MRVLLFYGSIIIFTVGLILLVAMRLTTDFVSIVVPVFLCISGIGMAAYISCLHPEVRQERQSEGTPLMSLEIEPHAAP